MRVAFLYTELSSYFLDCLKALKENTDIEVLLIHWPGSSEAPFQFGSLEWIGPIYSRTKQSPGSLEGIVRDFKPDIIYTSGWADRIYLTIAKRLSDSAFVVMGMDNQWKGTFRQYLAAVYSRVYLKRFVDAIWVPGDKQKAFASRLGFRGTSCWEGLYTCNVDKFTAASVVPLESRKRAFLYVGRYTEEKGLETLARAYQAYRQAVRDPWDLVCAGTGTFRSDALLDPAITHIGFIQPEEIPSLMGQYRGFILPSRYEPWGLVIHEATAAGLPVICTDACGAAAHLVKHQQNGFVYTPDDVHQLSDAMASFSKMSAEAWTVMHHRSLQLSRQYTPGRWVNTLLSHHHKDSQG